MPRKKDNTEIKARKKCKLCEEFYKQYPPQLDDDPLEKGKKREVHIVGTDLNGQPFYTSALKECAFKNGKFTVDNWGCQTLSQLRDLCGELSDYSSDRCDGFHYRDDMWSATIGVLHIPEPTDDREIQQGYIVMTWYKSRGRVGQAYVMCDDDTPELLTLETAEWVIEAHQNG